eukprot:scaffold15170_cov69-Phaeocystis_antarctica.AAC.3
MTRLQRGGGGASWAVSTDLELLEIVGDERAVLIDGRVAADGKQHEPELRLGGEAAEQLPAPRRSRLPQQLPASRHVPASRRSVASRCRRCRRRRRRRGVGARRGGRAPRRRRCGRCGPCGAFVTQEACTQERGEGAEAGGEGEGGTPRQRAMCLRVCEAVAVPRVGEEAARLYSRLQQAPHLAVGVTRHLVRVRVGVRG